MKLYNSATYRKDLEETVAHYDFFDALAGKTLLVTGATGLICSGILDLCIAYNEGHTRPIRLCAAGRSEERMRQRFGDYCGRAWFRFVRYDASRSNRLDCWADYIIHGASNAYPAAVSAHPIETMLSNFSGMEELLRYACRVRAKNTVFISSSEVYGQKTGTEPFSETEYGYVDLLNPRNSYSVSKRAAETLCASYAHEKGLPVNIVRPGHIYGPTASRKDNRVSSMFAYQAAEGEALVMKSDGSQLRSYCYVLDCATAILTVLLRGAPGEAYNVANPASVLSIREMAELLAESGGVPLRFELPTGAEKAAFNPMSNSSLRSDRLVALGWEGRFDPREGLGHTVQILREAAEPR